MAIIEDNGVELFAPGQQIQFAHTANNVVGVLAVACGASDTTISLSPGGGALFPNAPFYVSIEFEVLWCLSKSGDSLIVQRGQDGTTATSHVVGSSVEMRNNAGLWTDAYNGINSVSTDVGNLAAGITNKTALPPDTTFAGNTQELTHKTIDLTDSSKGNVIIGTVQPDPASLPLQNLLINGGFEEWYGPTAVTLAAGTPTSGSKQAWFANAWQVFSINDSAITVTKDTANLDPLSASGTDVLVNVSTVQAADWVSIQCSSDPLTTNGAITPVPDVSDINKLIGVLLSASLRIKLISGANITVKFGYVYYDGAYHNLLSTPVAVSSTSYTTFKFENQKPLTSAASTGLWFIIQFQGVGQVAVDNVMVNVGATAVGYRPRLSVKPTIATNLLTNGGFEYWQRGPGPFIANSGSQPFFCDRWASSVPGTSTFSNVQRTGSPGPGGGNASLSGSYTHGSSVGAIAQTLRFSDGPNLQNQVVSASLWVASNAANNIQIRLYDGIVAAYGPMGPGLGNNGWQRITCSFVVSSNATYLEFDIFFSATQNFYLDSATLVMGAIPADYVITHPADELNRCYRYYETIGIDGNNNFPSVFFYGSNGQTWAFPLYFGARRGGQPTLTNKGTWGGNGWSSITLGYAGFNGVQMQVVANTTGGAITQVIRTADSVNGITSEWNP